MSTVGDTDQVGRSFLRQSALPAVTTKQMAEIDRLMIEDYGIQLIQMMENAGRNLAEQARRDLDGELQDRRVIVLCGAGNNGGGGMVAARHLHNRGARVRAVLAAEPSALKEVPQRQWDSLKKLGLTAAEPDDLGGSDLLIDALIGYGLHGDPRGLVAEWIERANQAGPPILSLDAPSGLDTTTGAAGSPCIQADTTLTLALPKTGLLQDGARRYVGKLYVADIGVPPELYSELGLPAAAWFAEDSIVAAA